MKKILTFICFMGAFNYSICYGGNEAILNYSMQERDDVARDNIRNDAMQQKQNQDQDQNQGDVMNEPTFIQRVYNFGYNMLVGYPKYYLNAYIFSPIVEFKDSVKNKATEMKNTAKEIKAATCKGCVDFYNAMKTYSLAAVLISGGTFVLSGCCFGFQPTIEALGASVTFISGHMMMSGISLGILVFLLADNLVFKSMFTKALATGTLAGIKAFGIAYKDNLSNYVRK